MVEIKGLEKFAPKDFPGHISSTVFLAGCNFRCPYCHNADLVVRPETLAGIPMDFFLAYLDSRKGWLEAVCVTGGEPLREPELEDLLTVLKGRDLLVKIDTNGSFPDKLEGLIRAGLVDWVAMDVKAPIHRYAEVTRSKVNAETIERSIQILRDSRVSSVFRTTVVPGLVGEDDVLRIARWLKGARIYQLQQFSPVGTLDPDFGKVAPDKPEVIRRMAEIAGPYFDEVRIEGI